MTFRHCTASTAVFVAYKLDFALGCGLQAILTLTGSAIGNESAPKQLAQCRFPGLAISNVKI